VAEVLPVIDLARPGETAWSLSGQHSGANRSAPKAPSATPVPWAPVLRGLAFAEPAIRLWNDTRHLERA
jgi:hypothetical protein